MTMRRHWALLALLIATSVQGHAHDETGERKWDCVHDKVNRDIVVQIANQTYLPRSPDGRRQADEWKPIRIAVISTLDDSLGKE